MSLSVGFYFCWPIFSGYHKLGYVRADVQNVAYLIKPISVVLYGLLTPFLVPV